MSYAKRMTTNVIEIPSASASRLLAQEIRAELGRQGINQAELCRRLNVSDAWVSRRIAPRASTEITLEEVVRMAEALGIAAERLFRALLPRLDSNQQPSDYQYAQVIDLVDYRFRVSSWSA